VATPLDQPYRGSGIDRPTGLPLPPDPMPLVRAGILLKRWHYATFWSPELLLCAAQVRVGPIAQEYWGVWDRRDKRFWQRTHYVQRRVSLLPMKVAVDEADVGVELPFEPSDEFEVYRPQGQAYIWSRKQFCVRATATVRLEATTRRTDGAVFVDVNAGYHTRHTRWRWSAGAGRDQHGRTVAWNVIVGLFDTPQQSERTVWIDGVPSEIGPVRFSEDLRSVSFSEGGEIRFQQEANIRKRVGLFLVKSRYDHAFGPWEGSLPGGIQLKNAVGVRERQDALW
jgi:Protein of unknown function (DUF2804)